MFHWSAFLLCHPVHSGMIFELMHLSLSFFIVHQDRGPQCPTDIKTMLKNGTNIIQAAGYFNGM